VSLDFYTGLGSDEKSEVHHVAINKEHAWKLDNWSIVESPGGNRVVGMLHGYDRVRYLCSQLIDEVAGNLVLCRGGSVYELGEPDPEYVQTLGGTFNPQDPLKRAVTAA
jgi:hypothetical protein